MQAKWFVLLPKTNEDLYVKQQGEAIPVTKVASWTPRHQLELAVQW